MKKLMTAIAAAVLAVSAYAKSNPRATWTDEEGVTWSFTYSDETETACLTGASGFTDTLSIPYWVSVGDALYDVTEINNSAFSAYNDSRYMSVKTVVIPASVEIIRPNAFDTCRGITRLEIQEPFDGGLKTIYAMAFYNCSGLTEVTIPWSVEKIDNSSFSGCSNLNDVKFSGNPGDIDMSPRSAFAATPYLTRMTVNDNFANATEITGAEGVLEACNDLATLEPGEPEEDDGAWLQRRSLWWKWKAPAGMTSAAFYTTYSDYVNCVMLDVFTGTALDSLSKVGFTDDDVLRFQVTPGKTYYIRVCAFDWESGKIVLGWKAAKGFALVEFEGQLLSFLGECPESVTIPNTVSWIGKSVFSWDTHESVRNLKSVVIPESVALISYHAFYCDNLASVTFNEGLRYLDYCAFLRCYSLAGKTLKLPSSVEGRSGEAFYEFDGPLTVQAPSHLESKLYSGSYGLKENNIPTELTVQYYMQSINNRLTVNLNPQGGTFARGLPGGTNQFIQVWRNQANWNNAISRKPRKTGYMFDGFWTAPNGGKQVWDADMKYVSGTGYWSEDGKWTGTESIRLDVYAHWTLHPCDVNFDGNGGQIDACASLLSNSCVGDLYNLFGHVPTPTRSGFTFNGWYTAKVGGWKVLDSTLITEDVTYYAQWTKDATPTYKVTFGKNGGTGGDSYVTATYGAAMPAATAPTLSGWTFGGYWDTLALDEKGNAKGKQYYDANMKSVRNWDKESATTLWAKWTNKVTLGKNGGTGGDNYVTCTKGQPMPKRTMPTKSGYVFDGYWTSTGAGGVKYYNADGTSAHAWDKSGSVTLWAKWVAAVQVKVTFGKNGGTGGDNYVTATTGQPMPTPRTAPTLKGWSFGGYWDTLACDAKGNPLGKQYYNSKMESVRNWDKTAATTLWAKWTVKVTLGKNGGTGGDSTVTVIKGQPFPKRTMPTKSGYTFGGYFVSASTKTGQCYNPDGTGTASMKWSTGGTPTIWALWTKTSACVELPTSKAQQPAAPITPAVPTAAPSAAPETAPQSAVSAGIYSGVLADGSGAFWLMLDEPEKDEPRTAFLYVASEDGALTAECTVQEVDGILLLMTDGGGKYVVDIAAGIAICP